MVSWLKQLYQRLPVIREMNTLRRELERQQLLQDAALRTQVEQYVLEVLNHPKYADPKRLSQHEGQVFSQNGEDGIISEIFRRIGTTTKTFVEIGVGDGLQNNTALLLSQQWKGWWYEADDQHLAAIKKYFAQRLEKSTLKVVQAFVDAENINGLLSAQGVPADLDLVSLDIDLNTYYVWRSMLPTIKPRVYVIEYNGYFPSQVDWKVDYDPQGVWDQSSQYWGASLKAYERLGHEHGYQLVGCDLTGVNAFFVRADLCQDRFATPATAEHLYEPARGHLLAWRNIVPPAHLATMKNLQIREASRAS